MALNDKIILVGVISGAHGIKGDLLVTSYTDPATNLFNMKLIDDKNNAVSLKLRGNSKHKFICRMKDIDDRNAAESLIGMKFFCLRSSLPILVEDEFYIEDLIGLTVVRPDLSEIGAVKNILNYGGGEIVEIEFTDKSTTKLSTELFPFTKEFFPEITEKYIIFNDLVVVAKA